MKNIMKLIVLVGLLISMCTSAFGAIEPTNMVFTPDKGGKYIYSNNVEAIERENLSDISNPNPKYLMSNDNLGVSNYTIFISHINHTDLLNEDKSMKALGYDIEVDVEFKAKTDVKLELGSIGFETARTIVNNENGVIKKSQNTRSLLNAFSTYKQMPIYTINSNLKYYPQENYSVSVTLKAGETLWLSKYINNYSEVAFLNPIHIMGEFKITEGVCDVNVAALKSNGKLKDRNNHSPNVSRAIYYNDKQYKGIADSKPSVTTNLNYTIDDSITDGTKLPVKIFNQYQPKGLAALSWVTNINPQDDVWTRSRDTESDMLSFTYYDENKKNCYGSGVEESKKDSIWTFDVFHSDTKRYKNETFFTAETFVPNFILPTNINNVGSGCNLGNYGVALNYNITVKNDGTNDRYFNYKLNTGSQSIVVVKDEKGKPVENYAICKAKSDTKKEDTVASILLPKGVEKNFIIEVTLPTNNFGGIENYFEISDTQHKNEFYENSNLIPSSKYKYTGKEYYKWYDNKLYTSKDMENWQEQKIDDAAKQIFNENWNNYEIKYANDGYIVRWDAYDGVLNFYPSALPYHNKVYFLDKNFKLESVQKFDIYVTDTNFEKGNYYVKTKNKAYISQNKAEWKEINLGL